MLFILFGFPGTGKTFTGNILKKHFAYHFYDGDRSLPQEMKAAIYAQKPVTDTMRDTFFQKLHKKILSLEKKYGKLVIAQTYIQETYRQNLLKQFSHARFVLVETHETLRRSRLLKQKTYPLTLSYIRQMEKKFETPKIQHDSILNNSEGEKKLMKNIQLLLRKNNG